MKCVKCNTECADTARFCESCGAPLANNDAVSAGADAKRQYQEAVKNAICDGD